MSYSGTVKRDSQGEGLAQITTKGDPFTDFARRLMKVPHREIKAKLDAEKEAKRTPKMPASPVSVALPKKAT
jgi:hypothetical protein